MSFETAGSGGSGPKYPRGVESSYLRIARSRWPVILICLVVGLGVSFGITKGLQKSYQAQSQVFINILGGNNVSEALDAAQLTSELIQSYAYVASSNQVATEVQRKLGLSSPPSLGATTVPGTLLLDLTATEPTPALAESVLATAMVYFAQSVKGYQAGIGTSVLVKTVQPASVSDAPVSPKKSLDLVYGGISGLLVGILLAGLLDALDKSFRDPSELEGLALGPLLGQIPRLNGVRSGELLVDGVDDPDGLEAYAALRASLRFLDPGLPLRSILFTSPLSGDGKTTTVANLAEVLARAGEVTVAVDADLRNPKLGYNFGLPADPGTTSVVIGAEPLGAALRWHGKLGILPPGPLPPNPSEILGSQPMAALVEALEERTDRVLIDGPAVLSVSDPLTLAPMVDGVVLVLKPGSTRRDDIAETCRRLEVVGARTVGYVLNMSTSRPGGGRQARYVRRVRSSDPGTALADLQLLAGGSGRSA